MSPEIDTWEKKTFLREIVTDKVNGLVLTFLDLLLDSHRIRFLRRIEAEFERLVKKQLGQLEVSIVTAVPADEETKKLFVEKLEHILKKKYKLPKLKLIQKPLVELSGQQGIR